MLRPTFGQLRGSSFPTAIGKCATDFGAVRSVANEIMERLLYDPLAPDEGWLGGWATMAFSVQPISPPNGFAYITTQRNVARLILIDVCSRPIKSHNGFFEFLEFGIGLQPRTSVCGAGVFPTQNPSCRFAAASFERDNVPTLTDLSPVPQFVRIFPSNSGDIRKTVLVQGKDQNGQDVLSMDPLTAQSQHGEVVSLTQPFSQTQNQFSQITGIEKQTTLGPLQIFQIDSVTGNQAPLSSMEPSETTASYRRYLITGLPNGCCNTPGGVVTVTAQAKLDWTPVITDTDYLFIPCLPALIEEGQSYRYSKIDNQISAALEAKHHNRCITLLNGQLDHYLGKVNTAITVPLFGSDRLRLNPR